MFHAFFSQQCFDRPITFKEEYPRAAIYRRADGTEVTVTCVGDTIDDGPLWQDTIYLGEVEKFVRSVY